MAKQRNWLLGSLFALVLVAVSMPLSASPVWHDLQTDHSIEMIDAVFPATADAPEVASPAWQIGEYRNPTSDFIATTARKMNFRLLLYEH